MAATSRGTLDGLPKTPAMSVINIVADGNLLLRIEDPAKKDYNYYRVFTNILRQKSAYFDRLLDPSKFSEGVKVKEKLAVLDQEYNQLEPSEIPTGLLPIISISDVGHFPKFASNKPALSRFFEILHRPGTNIPLMSSAPSKALLAVVADRFAAIDALAWYVKRHKDQPPNDMRLAKEEAARQNLLFGWILHHEAYVYSWSSYLIVKGSARWIEQENVEAASEAMDEEPMWWHLPNGLEGMLKLRSPSIEFTTKVFQRSLSTAVSASSQLFPPCKPIS